MFSDFIEKKKIRSEKTAKVYGNAIRLWAKELGYDEPDKAIEQIKTKGLDAYKVLQDLANSAHKKGLAPKTINSYVGAVKGFMVDCHIQVTEQGMKDFVVLPEPYEVNTDRAPTRDEVKRILQHCNLEARTEVTMLASSGMRIGELPKLTVSNVEFGGRGEPSKIKLKPGVTKTRKARVTFISPEATELLKEHLGTRITNPNARLFQEQEDAIYSKIMRALIKAGLRKKVDESVHYDLHPHCFRKYFHTNMLAKSVERGIVEGFEGHKFGLDSNYLRMSENQLKAEYMKGVEAVTFLSNGNGLRTKVEQMDSKLAEIEKIATEGGKGARLAVILAAKKFRDELREDLLRGGHDGNTVAFIRTQRGS